jgi:hypothetical protein
MDGEEDDELFPSLPVEAFGAYCGDEYFELTGFSRPIRVMMRGERQSYVYVFMYMVMCMCT